MKQIIIIETNSKWILKESEGEREGVRKRENENEKESERKRIEGTRAFQ